MSSLAPARPRGRLFSRYHCSRSGHEWKRQVLDSGAEARWVCTTCGKLGDEIPIITSEQEVVEMSKTPETSTPVDETVDAEPTAAESAEPAPDVVSAEAPEEESAGSRLRPAIAIAAIAAVSAIVVSGSVLAFQRRRR